MQNEMTKDQAYKYEMLRKKIGAENMLKLSAEDRKRLNEETDVEKKLEIMSEIAEKLYDAGLIKD